MNDESKSKSKKLAESVVQAGGILVIITSIIAIYQFVSGNQSIPASFTSGAKPTPAIQISPTLAPTVPLPWFLRLPWFLPLLPLLLLPLFRTLSILLFSLFRGRLISLFVMTLSGLGFGGVLLVVFVGVFSGLC